MTKKLEIGTNFEGTLKHCPFCNKREWEELDSMGTSRCGNCGNRFVPTFSGVMYVGLWKDYACKDMFTPPRNEWKSLPDKPKE